MALIEEHSAKNPGTPEESSELKKGKKTAAAKKNHVINPVPTKKKISKIVNEIVIGTPEEERSVVGDQHLQEMVIEDPRLSDSDKDEDSSAIIERRVTKDPYITACEALGVVPVSHVIEQLGKTELKIPNHGLGANGAR